MQSNPSKPQARAARPPLILASTSAYRRELLQRLRQPFAVQAPGVDEARRPGEAPRELALRLAREKALAVASAAGPAWVIGSDQVCACDGEILGKPGGFDAALRQLQHLRGREAVFHTAVALVDPQGSVQTREVPTTVRTRVLDDARLRTYLLAEQPYDCAGSAKSEGLGIALLQSVRSEDPTALVGLPLIALCDMLAQAGFDLLADGQA
ncbi:nucleoside triphosphate pyrophosphatase [Thiomonas sp. FB-6]|uniref:Maf family protein n=1 Tax=Thiomonas sp. FB-6 TaxID=1158291 RepID=UPI00036DEBCA|nr:Maf family nucleotide pyrophosphatase [Thiomonas sp. FB-6]